MRTYLTKTTIIRWTLLCLLVITGMLGANAQKDSQESYARLLELESQTLYEKGTSYRTGGTHLDSALVCFTILGNRAAKSKEENEHELGIKAYAEMAYIWAFHYYDYSKAIENLTRAKALMEKWNLDLPIYHLYYGLIYTSISTQSRDEKTRDIAMNYLRHAFHSAMSKGETHMVNVVFSNMVSHAYSLNLLDSIAIESALLRNMSAKMSKGPEANYTFFNLQIMEGLKALRQKRHADALSFFDKITDTLPRNEAYSRYHCGTWEFKGLVHLDAGQFPEAEKAFNTALKIADNFNLRDAKIELFHDMADLYQKWNNQSNFNLYQARYLNLKDSLLSFRQISAMDEIRFLGDLQNLETKLEETGRNNERMKRYLVAVGVLLLVAAAIIWFTVWFIRKLKKANRTLYAKNQEVFRAEEEERKLRTRYEKEISEMRHRLENSPEAELPGTPSSTVTKYKGSNLTDEAKEAIADKIRNVLETSPEIYSTEFSSETMAELVGEKYKYISQVINETWELNFNQLLNNYRIREACKRLENQKEYGHLTLEALAESVGFNSRSTFAVQFKRVTGLKPSQYISESRK